MAVVFDRKEQIVKWLNCCIVFQPFSNKRVSVCLILRCKGLLFAFLYWIPYTRYSILFLIPYLFLYRVENLVKVPQEYAFNVVPAFFDAMVGNTVLEDVIGADFFTAVAGPNLPLSLRR